MMRRAIETELTEIADELDELATRTEDLYRRRLELWTAATMLPEGERMTQRECGESSRVTEGAVTQALRKQRLNA